MVLTVGLLQQCSSLEAGRRESSEDFFLRGPDVGQPDAYYRQLLNLPPPVMSMPMSMPMMSMPMLIQKLGKPLKSMPMMSMPTMSMPFAPIPIPIAPIP